jgi:hypothetical protein
MPGDPEQCRLNAARCLKLSERAKNPARRQSLLALAETWAKLAAENESDEALLRTLSELEFDEPFYALPDALSLRAA